MMSQYIAAAKWETFARGALGAGWVLGASVKKRFRQGAQQVQFRALAPAAESGFSGRRPAARAMMRQVATGGGRIGIARPKRKEKIHFGHGPGPPSLVAHTKRIIRLPLRLRALQTMRTLRCKASLLRGAFPFGQ